MKSDPYAAGADDDSVFDVHNEVLYNDDFEPQQEDCKELVVRLAARRFL